MNSGAMVRMIAALIDGSLRHRWWVLAIVFAIAVASAFEVRRLAIDVLPDTSDTQAIVKLEFPGQPPQLVEDQLTYPLVSALLGTADVTAIRGYSMYGEGFIYVVFSDQANKEQARARVSERLAQLRGRFPASARISLGPDASGTGWVYQYALVADGADAVTPSALRAFQEFSLRPALESVSGVAEVATIGGSARQINIEVDPARMQAVGVTYEQIAKAVRDANQAAGAGAAELGRQRFPISMDARIKSPADLLDAPVGMSTDGGLLRLRQVAAISEGPAPREGVADLDGKGDTVGGIVVMRHGGNAYDVVSRVQDRIDELKSSLPKGVKLVTTHDRSVVIKEAVVSVGKRLLEEALVVALVCLVFLRSLRSAMVAVVVLPVGLLAATALMTWQGVTANIMSLGGLALAIGAMIDAAVVMVEAYHQQLESTPQHAAKGQWEIVADCAKRVGPALFISLLIITVSFLPVLTLEGSEAKLFGPLALTKTYAMAAGAVLSVTLVPVLMGLVRVRAGVGKRESLASEWLKRAYRPLLFATLRRPWVGPVCALAVAGSIAVPAVRIDGEFMPPLDEGDLLYMPSTLPGISLDEAADVLSRSNRLIRALPEVASVHGKAGRSNSATDPAPLSMIETVIRLKPRSEWPRQLTTEQLIAKLEQQVQFPGLTNSWGFPIRTRIEMLSTGAKTPLALMVSGDSLPEIDRVALEAEAILSKVPGVRHAFAERVANGRFVEIQFDRNRAASFGIRASEVAQMLDGAVGGAQVDEFIEGRQRFPLVVRLPRGERDSVAALENLRLRGESGRTVSLGDVAGVKLAQGPAEIRSENGKPVVYVFLDIDPGQAKGVLTQARARLAEAGLARAGVHMTWAGQYLRLERASSRLLAISAGAALAIMLILYAYFACWRRVFLVLSCLPVVSAGALWAVYLLGYHWSFATAVGVIALSGVAAEFCVVMLLYLDREFGEGIRVVGFARESGFCLMRKIVRGALLRLRPKAMTATVILGGLIPLLVSEGVGVDVLRRVAAPMVGGMLVAPAFCLLVVPSLYLRFLVRGSRGDAAHDDAVPAADSALPQRS